MEVIFQRVSATAYFSTATRNDGVTVRVPGYDRTSPIPHDLAHFVAEHEFGLARGFWGSVAAGAMFTNMKVVDGRRRPHADERSKRIMKANGLWLGAGEAVAGAVHDAVEEGHTAERALVALRKMHGVVSTEPLPVGVEDVERAMSALRAAEDRWAQVPAGEGMALSWRIPVYDPGLGDRRSKDRKGGRRKPRGVR
ncbi:hypothetical protein [Actinomadura rudentiformis]|uniref:Uncharacterized protein n=1 Tax=Actinomadura rudentiformis TaxID=359158 RepID=A0A6H9Z324_9ACTN|nr:hypothetical protein [Actinomadura rudentiformis]KAB2348847.1 hypothetical protein F8566_13825 [Actinomadura rudentiformis]